MPSLPSLPTEARGRIGDASEKAKDELHESLVECFESPNRPNRYVDLIPVFQNYARALLNAHAEEHLSAIHDTD